MLYWRRIVYLNNLFSPTRWGIPSPTPTTKPSTSFKAPTKEAAFLITSATKSDAFKKPATAKPVAAKPSPTATTSWSNTASPTDWYPATNTTVTTPWHRYTTGPMKTAKANNRLTTSTSTKSASRVR